MTEGVRRHLFRGYLAAVVLGGFVVALAVVFRELPLRLGPRPVVTGVLIGLVVLSELWPIPVPRGEEITDEITVSSTFGLALLFVAPLWVVFAAQLAALSVDEAVRLRSWRKLPFNAAQYVLSYGAARGAYLLILASHHHAGAPLGTISPWAALLAGAVFFVCNNGAIAVVLALSSGRGVLHQLSTDLRWQVVTAAPATALAPVAAATALSSLPLLLFLLTPLVAVHHSGRLASRREREALHDPLTGLANRTMLFTVLDRTLESQSNRCHAVMLIDLDHFKDINDTLGHAVGDELLKTAGSRLVALAGPGSLVARLGGDEFAILLRGTTPEGPQALAEQVVHKLRQPCRVDGRTLRVRGSVGVSMFPRDGSRREDLLRRADVALYKAKEARDGHVTYEPAHDRAAFDLFRLVNDLSAVLEDPAAAAEQLLLAYQPQVRAGDRKVVAVECLLRWAHPRLGLLLPDAFIPLAENSGLMGALTLHALDLAVAQQLRWAADGLDLQVAVNFSVPQLADPTLPETVAQALARHDTRPDRLVLEITERCLMADSRRNASILGTIRATGASVSIDDYGSGYCSLAYLKRLEVDELKIDHEYVSGLLHDRTDRVIVESTISLAHQLGVQVVGEGVEDEETAQELTRMGCDRLQGYHIGRPGSAADVVAACRVAAVPSPAAAPDRTSDPDLVAAAPGLFTSVSVFEPTPLRRRVG